MKKVLYALVLVLLLAPLAGAQTPPRTAAGISPRALAGEEVVVMTTDHARIKGRVRTLTDASLDVDTAAGLRSVPLSAIGRIVVKDSLNNGAAIGLAIGAATGLAGGLMIHAICVNETGGCPGAVLLLTAIGAGAGTALGAGVDGLQHRTVFNALSGVPGEHTPQLAVNLALGRSTTWGIAPVTGPASIGLTWGTRHASGFGLELDLNRTLGQQTRMLSCADSLSLPGCTGQGREGIEESIVGAAKVQYFFSKGRIQPYLSAGVGLHRTSVWATRLSRSFPGQSPHMLEVLSRNNGLAAVGGGGARIALTDRVFVRPDVTVYVGGEWTYVRAGVGLGVGW